MSSNFFSAALTAAINRDNRNTQDVGGSNQSMAQILEDLKAAVAAGNIGITADAVDVDALALGGEHFAQDSDTTTGLTFGYKAGRFHNGKTIVAVGASTIALSASQTNYVEVDRAGTVSTNTSGFTSGRLPLYQIVTGVSTITSGGVTNKKPLLTLIGAAGVTGDMLSGNAKTKSIELALGDISATAAFTFLCPPHVADMVKAAFATKTAIAASDTDYWTFALVNKGPSGSGTTDMLNTGDANTTKATGGSAVTGYVKRELTLHGTAANLDTADGDVLELTITKTGSATTMEQCTLRLDFTFES